MSYWCPVGWVIAPAEGGQHSNVTYVALTDLKVRTESDAPLPCLLCASRIDESRLFTGLASIAESICPPGGGALCRKLGLIPITLVAACMATRALLCAGQMIRQLLCRAISTGAGQPILDGRPLDSQ